MIRSAIIYLLLLFVLPAKAQEDTAYRKVVMERAGKIVNSLGITDMKKATQVQEIIAQQYIDIKRLEEEKTAHVKDLKQQGGDKTATDDRIKAQDAAFTAKLDQLHHSYLGKLSASLQPAQVTQVKDGMTYGVLPVTYNAYLNMLPQLTEQQKTQIMEWLVEAREHAMDAGSSEKKHAWFGKYKGRINNYLSAAGVNMKQAEADWKKRRSEKQ